eukprot:g7484.t1
MLSTQASCLTVLFICFASAVQVRKKRVSQINMQFQILLGLSIGYFLSKLVSAKFDTAQTKTSSCNSHYPNPSKYELENFVTVACAFGNPWALATLFLTTLFPNQSESVQGLVALFLLCWNPLFWTLGQFILSAASVQTTSHQDFLQKIRSVLQPPTMGLLVAVLVCLAPAGRRLFTTCSVSEVAGAGLVSTGVVICVRFVLEVMRSLSTATMPIQTIILGTALNHTLNNDIPKWMPPIWNNASEATAFGLIAFGRFLILPTVNWIVLNLLSRFGVLVEDRICRVMLFAMSVMPPAQNLVLALNLKSETRHLVPLAARFLLGWYLLSIVPVTIWAPTRGRIVLISESGVSWGTRKRSLKKFLRRLKRRSETEFLEFGELVTESLQSDDLVLLFHNGTCLPESVVLILTQFVTRRFGALLIVPYGDETENALSRRYLNELTKRFSVTIESSAPMSVAVSQVVQHPLQIYIRDPPRLVPRNAESETHQSSEPNGVLISSTAILSCQKPSIALLKTDQSCFPSDQAIGAVWHQNGAGRVVILGCYSLFYDSWIDREANNDYIDQVVTWLTSNSLTIPKQISDSPSPTSLSRPSPEIRALAEVPKYCLGLNNRQEGLEFDWSLFGFDFQHVSKVQEVRKELHVTESQLSIIAPQLLVPTRVLHPTYFRIEGPRLRPLPLELFDLDEEVKDRRSKLDVAYRKAQSLISFTEQAGGICQLNGSSPHDILHEALKQIVEYKK